MGNPQRPEAPPLSPLSLWVLIPLPPLFFLEWERFWVQPFVLSPPACSLVGSSLTQERRDLCGCEQRVVVSHEKRVQSLNASAPTLCHSLGVYSWSTGTKQQ